MWLAVIHRSRSCVHKCDSIVRPSPGRRVVQTILVSGLVSPVALFTIPPYTGAQPDQCEKWETKLSVDVRRRRIRRGRLICLTTMDQPPSLFPSIEVATQTISAPGPMTSTVRIQGASSIMKVPPGHHDMMFTTIDFKGLVRS